ncbi:uncharacterized protein LOC132559560 [Ylistrum balloti]|uniref:uncharacterized protein LOC132559560 n=1 Tax=Ylistrum balloti TaxID=509963 RepID=UPI002905CA78|nr:uncharacterized protein LOC132559560 [Ylistrum balloti]
MGCNNSKTEENTQGKSLSLCWQRKNKVAPTIDPTPEKAGPSQHFGVSNMTRKTEQTVLMQLKEEGIVPRKGDGGVAFVLDICGISESDDLTSLALPGVPEYKRKYPQYASYSWEVCRAAIYGPPRRLPPINRASIDAKQERARRNREKKAAERKAKWAKSYARVQATLEKTSDS